MGKELKKLHRLINDFYKGNKTDTELYMLVYKAYLLGLGQEEEVLLKEDLHL